jgi:ferredoxin-like protein FixX
MFYIFFQLILQPAKYTAEEVAMKFSKHSAALNACIAYGDTKSWKFLREKTLEIQGDRCLCCGKKAAVMHIDHIKPKSRYPHLEFMVDNLQVLCPTCNKQKSYTDETDYRRSNHLISLVREIKENKLLRRKYVYNMEVLEKLAQNRFELEMKRKDYPQTLPIS